MKNVVLILIISILALLSAGCEQQLPPEEDTELEHTAEKMIKNSAKGDVEVIIIDGCEYLIYKEAQGNNQGYGFMAHKGNCKNPIHIYKELAGEGESQPQIISD